MFEKLEITRMAQALASYAGSRTGVISRNIAHADTPGFKAQDLPDFAKIYQGETLSLRATRPGHLDAADSGPQARTITVKGAEQPNGNTVSLEQEMVRAVDARQTHDMALAIYRATSDVIRSSLGRK